MCGMESLSIPCYLFNSFPHFFIPNSLSFYYSIYPYHIISVMLRKLVCVKSKKEVVLV